MVERKPLVLIHLLTAFLLMALTSFLPTTSNVKHDRHHHRKRKDKPTPPANNPTPSSWEQLKSILSCRSIAPSQIHNPSIAANATISSKHARLGSTCGSSICPLRDVVHGNTRVIHRTDSDHSSRSDSWALVQHEPAPLAHSARNQPPPSKGGTQFPKLSGCYECHAVAVEPLSRRYPRPRTLSACSDCGEVFTKPDGLELHQTLRHAVSELGPEDSGRNIVEIIFKSSWLKKDPPICMIERILKVHNTQRTIARFENYRDSVKARARALALPHLQPSSSGVPHQLPKKNPRCAADGNELLRFHCTTLSCPLGARGSTALCISSPATAAPAAPCSVCTIIRHGFARAHQSHHPHGVRTTASSGRAHDYGPPSQEGAGGVMTAMLVCRVIAGRIKRASDDAAAEEDGAGGWYDSVAGEEGGPYANLEELFVSNPRAILPCFVVIYRALD